MVAAPSHLIAVVDDDKVMREAIEGLVRSMGHRAMAYDSASGFLESRAQHAFSCIITDVQMPGLSGLDLQDALATAGVSTPIIFVTALPREDVRRRAVEAGSICFLIKPFRAEDLIRCIEEAIDRATPGPGQA